MTGTTIQEDGASLRPGTVDFLYVKLKWMPTPTHTHTSPGFFDFFLLPALTLNLCIVERDQWGFMPLCISKISFH